MLETRSLPVRAAGAIVVGLAIALVVGPLLMIELNSTTAHGVTVVLAIAAAKYLVP